MSLNIRGVKLDKNIAPSYNTYSEDGLTVTIGSSRATKSTLSVLKGVSYCEVEIKSENSIVGIASDKLIIDDSIVFSSENSEVISYSSTGWFYYNGVLVTDNTISYTQGDFIGLLIDTNSDKITFYKNGIKVVTLEFNFSSYSEIYLLLSSGTLSNITNTVNFGDTVFKYIPSDLPKETIAFGGGSIFSSMVVKNPTTNQYYSLAEKTLITLLDDSNEIIFNYGIKSGTEIKLDEPFDNIIFVNNSANASGGGKVFSYKINNSNAEIKNIIIE